MSRASVPGASKPPPHSSTLPSAPAPPLIWVSPPAVPKSAAILLAKHRRDHQPAAASSLKRPSTSASSEDDDDNDNVAPSPLPVKRARRSQSREMVREIINIDDDDVPAPMSAKRVEELKQMDEITDILSLQTMEGGDDVYLVKLEGGRRVRVGADALAQYPDLMEEFERKQDRRNGGGHRAATTTHTASSSDRDEETVEPESDAYDGGSGDQMSEDDVEDIRNFIADDDDDDDAPRRKRGGKGKGKARKMAPEATRKSSRATRHQEGFVDEGQALSSAESTPSSSEEEPLSARLRAPAMPARAKKTARELVQVMTIDDDEDELENVADTAKHCQWCQKCQGGPADLLLKQLNNKKRKRANGRSVSTGTESETDVRAHGAFIECGTCVAAYHFACLPRQVQADISRATRADAMAVDGGLKRELDIKNRLSVPHCPDCSKSAGQMCTVKPCKVAAAVDAVIPAKEDRLFRCWKCKRAAHWCCLPYDAKEYQDQWLCDDCDRWGQYNVEVILAWRVPGMKDDDPVPEEWRLPSYKDVTANAEYLVKFADSSYRNVEWLPHVYLAKTCAQRLRNFLDKGPSIDISTAQPSPITPTDDGEVDVEETLDFSRFKFDQRPDPGAQAKIPVDWTSVDRVLDVRFSDSGAEHGWISSENVKLRAPPHSAPLIERAIECLFKWKSLSYGDATWDTPPAPGDPDYENFRRAYVNWVRARGVLVPKLSSVQIEKLNLARSEATFPGFNEQPVFIKGGKLKPFQVDGVGWLLYKWWLKTNVILADEMGLGKTIQIIAFLSVLFQQENARPFLCVVPNSTHANWMREFAKWAPDMVVVPFVGDQKSRKVIEQYELLTSNGNLRCHCIVTTFEHVMNNATLFTKVPRFEVMIVDEGQRLKGGDTGKLFKVLSRITAGQKVILSGTPINNNLDELFALLNFLDPKRFDDLPGYKARFENLDATLVTEVQEMLKPHFLRRVKDKVLDLPPLHSIIVPVSLRPLQKRVYRDVLEKNVASISSLFQPEKGAKARKVNKSFNNILMELRKTCAHPYLVSPEIEQQGVSEATAHAQLVDASEKLRVLQMLLPKLKARGHRVLIFSQFVIVLDILERFLEGEKIKHVRLDGGVSGAERQKGIDAFNRDGSDILCYILTTRAGGVGINLATADTVILFDHDWNPFQDLQAISRAHRIGQTRPVTCYKLMVKGSCEEKMIAAGKKKMVLEHLIVQRIDQEQTDDASEDVASFLEYGAKAIFEQGEQESADDIRYKPEDIDALLDRSEAEMPKQADGDSSQQVLAYARVWERTKGNLTELEEKGESANIEEQRGFWSHLLDEKTAQEEQDRLNREAQLGRGRRERKQLQQLQYSGFDSDQEGSPKHKPKPKPKEGDMSDDDFEYDKAVDSDADEGEESEPSALLGPEDRDMLKDPNAPTVVPKKKPRRPKHPPPPLIPPYDPQHAGGHYPRPAPIPGWHHYDDRGWPVAANWQQYVGNEAMVQPSPSAREPDPKRWKPQGPSPRVPLSPKHQTASVGSAGPSSAKPTHESHQSKRDQAIRQLADKAALLRCKEVDELLALAVCKQGREQIQCLMDVTRLMKAEKAKRLANDQSHTAVPPFASAQ